jgi:thioredoxin-like negative regulator of GroEL
MTFDEVKKLDGWTVVLFYGTACAPCERIKPMLREVCGQAQLRLVEVNAAGELDAVRKLGIRAVPTVVVVKEGKSTIALAGGAPTSPEALVAFLRIRGLPL